VTLRTCIDCSFEARSLDDLELFVIDKGMKYNRTNLCLPCKQIRNNRYRGNNSGVVKEYAKDYRNTHKESNKAYQKVFRQSPHGRALKNAAEAKRNAIKLGATPSWLNKDQLQEIKVFYKLSQILTEATPFPWHVDHIYPLQGENSCGLHVPWNLQVIPAHLNMSKGNKLPQSKGHKYDVLKL